MMKVYLDDERTAPKGWVQVRWPYEAIALLKQGDVVEISLDHDLGDDDRGTGYDVLKWIELSVWNKTLRSPIIHIHTANPSARVRMELAVEKIKRLEYNI